MVTVKKATSAYDTGVAGIVDRALYVPDAATREPTSNNSSRSKMPKTGGGNS